MKTAENRAATGAVAIETNKLFGQWMLYNEPSEMMVTERDGKAVAFREIITPEAMKNALISDVKCCADHREIEKYLGRTPTSLRITENDRGWAYECDLMEGIQIADEVRQYVQRGDYGGNSFRFYVKSDAWERQQNGQYLRMVNEIHSVEHIGPVKNPAYINTDVSAAMRSLTDSGLLQSIIEAGEVELRDLHNYQNTILNLKEKQIRWI
jgi:hypothetical protein